MLHVTPTGLRRAAGEGPTTYTGDQQASPAPATTPAGLSRRVAPSAAAGAGTVEEEEEEEEDMATQPTTPGVGAAAGTPVTGGTPGASGGTTPGGGGPGQDGSATLQQQEQDAEGALEERQLSQSLPRSTSQLHSPWNGKVTGALLPAANTSNGSAAKAAGDKCDGDECMSEEAPECDLSQPTSHLQSEGPCLMELDNFPWSQRGLGSQRAGSQQRATAGAGGDCTPAAPQSILKRRRSSCGRARAVSFAECLVLGPQAGYSSSQGAPSVE
jgi:hypothetical protein